MFSLRFVKYTSDEEVVKAIERFNGTQLDQSVLVVERAVQKDRDRNMTRNQEQGYYPKRDLQGISGWTIKLIGYVCSCYQAIFLW